MKVLFLTNVPSPYRVDFFNELGRYCELTVAFEGENATDRDKKWRAAEVRNFKAVFLKGIRTKSDQFLCLDIFKVIKDGFDRIVVGGYSTPTGMLAIEFMRLHRIPFWIEADGGMISQDSAIKDQVKKHFISAASGWFSSGKVTTDYFVHYGANANKVYTYPFTSLKAEDIAADTPTMEEKNYLRDKLKLRNKVVLTVGRFSYRGGYGKGFDVLLKAMQYMPNEYSLYIVGDEPTEEFLQMKEKLGAKNVFFVSFKTKEELKEYYKAADVFCLQTRGDVWGLVINEAMANGLPVITTDRCVAGLELVENDVNGYIVPVEDSEILAEKISYVLKNDDVRKKMAQNSLKKIKDWTIENMAKCHGEVLDSVIQEMKDD